MARRLLFFHLLALGGNRRLSEDHNRRKREEHDEDVAKDLFGHEKGDPRADGAPDEGAEDGRKRFANLQEPGPPEAER